MKHRAPVCYADWEPILRAALGSYGYTARQYFNMKMLRMPKAVTEPMCRVMWRKLHRPNRIHQQMSECVDRRDPSILRVLEGRMK